MTGTDFAALLGGVADAVVATAQDRPAVLLAGLLALLTVGWTASWRLTRGVVTIVHEGGHALAAVLTGRGLGGIRLHADSSGVTTSTGRAGGVGLVLTFLGGYPAPAALGLGGAVLVGTGRTAAFLWLAVGLLVATLTQVRNAFGIVSAALVWFLLFGGLRSVRELQRGRSRVPARFGGESDADALARLTGVPGGMWSALFWLLAAVAMITGAWVLVGRIA